MNIEGCLNKLNLSIKLDDNNIRVLLQSSFWEIAAAALHL